MLISKKKLCDLFYNYTNMIYMECGRKLLHIQKATLKKRIEKIANEYTFKGQIKKIIEERKKKNV